MKSTEQLIGSVGKLSENAFCDFVKYLLKLEYGENLKQSDSVHNTWYTCFNDSSLHVNGLLTQIYCVDYMPYELFFHPENIPFDNPLLRLKIQSIHHEMEEKSIKWQPTPFGSLVGSPIESFCFFTNALYSDSEELKEIAFKQLDKMLQDLHMDKTVVGSERRVLLGSPYSFVKYAPERVIEALQYADKNNTFLSIELSDNGFEVNRYRQDGYVTSGVGRLTRDIYYPAEIKRTPDKICAEFENLLNNSPSEIAIHEFVCDNYKYIFGEKYDKIVRELGLRFPELDISNKNRRVDLMIHDICTVFSFTGIISYSTLGRGKFEQHEKSLLFFPVSV